MHTSWWTQTVSLWDVRQNQLASGAIQTRGLGTWGHPFLKTTVESRGVLLGEKVKDRRRKVWIKALRGQSKSKGGGEGGSEHLNMWWFDNTWPTPSIWHKTEWPNPYEGWKLHDPPPMKHDIFGCIIQQNHILCMKLWYYTLFRFIS